MLVDDYFVLLDTHIAAGADQVAIQVASADHLTALRALAPLLTAHHRTAQ